MTEINNNHHDAELLSPPVKVEVLEAMKTEKPGEVFETHDALLMQWDRSASAIRTSLDPQTQRGRALITQCLEAADHGIAELGNQVVEVSDFFAHIGELENPATGEMEPKTRCVLVLKDGRRVSTWSPSAIKGFAFLANLAGPGPWNPPLKIRIRLCKGKSGFNYATISEVISEELNDNIRRAGKSKPQ